MADTTNISPTAATAQPANNNEIFELNTILMNFTFLISGPSAKEEGKRAIGTGFVISKPDGKGFSYFVLATAAHVLDDIAGDIATINVRSEQPDGSYKVSEWPFFLRENSKNIYVKHKIADVAAIYIALPEHYTKKRPLGDALLATEDDLKKYEVHPGDRVFCLGYPLGGAGPFGFPILRSGALASYPLTPTSLHPAWIFDLRIFGGNSGGPAYLIDRSRMYGNNVNLGETLHVIVGLVTRRHDELQLGLVVPSTYIRQTMESLPEKPPSSTSKRPGAPK